MKNNINKKPSLAALFSTIFPGAGFFYLENYTRGFIHLGTFILIIGILNSSIEYNEAVFGVLLAGAYLFQIFDAYNYGHKLSGRKEQNNYDDIVNTQNPKEEKTNFEEERLSLTGSIILLILGIFMQLVNLEIVKFRDIFNYWPVLLIVIGMKLIFQSYKGDKNE